jgi:hypothetical protein
MRQAEKQGQDAARLPLLTRARPQVLRAVVLSPSYWVSRALGLPARCVVQNLHIYAARG